MCNHCSHAGLPPGDAAGRRLMRQKAVFAVEIKDPRSNLTTVALQTLRISESALDHQLHFGGYFNFALPRESEAEDRHAANLWKGN
jgi:hypothetical protein